MKSIRFAIALSATIVAVAAAPSAQAQLRRTTPTQIGTYPGAGNVPAGMCQVWINGLPANRQPAPTDCATARANAPSNSRIIYGSNTGGYGSNTGGTYDPRRDPRSAQYDPRYGQYGGQQYPGQRGRGNADWKAEKERQKAALKAQRQRDKEWKQENKHGNRDGDENDNRGNGNGRYGNRGNTSGSCIDANSDGICDYRQQGQRTGSIRFP
jgi:hypothetical protein